MSMFAIFQRMMQDIMGAAFDGDASLRALVVSRAFKELMESASTTPFVGYAVWEEGTAPSSVDKSFTTIDLCTILCLCDVNVSGQMYDARLSNLYYKFPMGNIGPNRLLRLQKFFHDMDLDDSGSISKVELIGYIRKDPKLAALLDFGSTKPTKRQLEELFRQLDVYTDGESKDAIDFEEFVARFTDMPAREFWAIIESRTSVGHEKAHKEPKFLGVF